MPRLSQPRLKPRDESQWDEESRQLLTPNVQQDKVYNIFRTLTHHPKLMKRWMVFANHILLKSSLPPRDREILILRIGWLCKCDYEWSQHVEISRRETDLTDEEIARIKEGPDAPGWRAHDKLLLQATDELHKDAIVSDATWAGLAKTYNEQQLMDVVFTVGNYNLVSMALNSFGVPLDGFLKGFDQ
jgi:alkylhydroperoxidase family enzyme